MGGISHVTRSDVTDERRKVTEAVLCRGYIEGIK